MGEVPRDTTELFTIGHSNHEAGRFVELLRQHRIEAVADVRSSPYSRHVPHFSSDALKRFLSEAGVSYVFLGKELGARPAGPGLVVDGRMSYERMAARPEFLLGIERVLQGAAKYRLALLCAEKDPTECHRMILVCRQLKGRVSGITHILADGAVESNLEAERRLYAALGLARDLFRQEDEVIEQAYERREAEIAFRPG